MTNAIVLHGKPSRDQYFDSNFPDIDSYYWLPWLDEQLTKKGIPTVRPKVPNGWIADYDVWKNEFEKYPIDKDTILVGHSCGAGFLVKWLSTHPGVSVNKIILVAPWIDPRREETTTFFDCEFDRNLVTRTQNGISIIYSDDDVRNIIESVAALQEKIDNLSIKKLHGHKHFYDENSMTIPVVLNELPKDNS